MEGSESEKRNFLILHLEEIFESLTKACDFVKDKRKLSAVKAKWERANDMKREYDALRLEILNYNAKVDKSDYIATKLDHFDTLFEAINAKYLELAERNVTFDITPDQPDHVVPNLQPLKLIDFNGNIDHWIQFKTLFDSLVHDNPHISNIQKLHYLKAHLKGEAATLIENIALEPKNYVLCYEILQERYSSPRRLINFYLGQLLNYPMKDAKDYSKFLSTHSNAVKGLRNLDLPDALDSVLLHLCYLNLSSADKHAFDNTCDPNGIPDTEELFDFLKRRVHTSEFQHDLDAKSASRLYLPPQRRKVSLITAPAKVKKSEKFFCPFCAAEHKIYWCPKFLKLSPLERNNWIAQKSRCSKCLGNHLESLCISTGSCKECSSPKHHTLLHEHSTAKKESLQCAVAPPSKEPVLLGTLKLQVKGADNTWVTIRGLLDSASQVNLMTRECAARLRLPLTQTMGPISGVSCQLTRSCGALDCEISLGNQTTRTSNFIVMKTICSPQPNFVVSRRFKRNFQHLQLADEDFLVNSPIDVLLGAELVCQLLSNDEPVFLPGNPSALRTHYGYVLVGKLDSFQNFQPNVLFMSNEALNEELKRFWEIEDIPKSNFERPEDLFCENFFQKTHSRTPEGRYQVRFPLKPNSEPLNANREKVLSSYLYNEKRMLKTPLIKSQYDEFLQNYLNLDYMELAKAEAEYLHTHHVVFKDSSSTALRVVINGSTPDLKGRSLNSILYSGPKLQASLPDILDYFRSYTYVLIADISKMFSQILLHPEDRKLQHIFWRNPDSGTISEYELKRLSFGHASSPWLALRVIKQLLLDEGHLYPHASFALSHCTYIDDVITGSNSLEAGETLIQELRELLTKGGFTLKKWISNEPNLLKGISNEDLETPRIFSDETSYFKVLGITWLPQEDVFSFTTSAFQGPTTKRNILSFIARLFDPCGWCSPVVLQAKLFVQRTWLLGLAWDDPLPEDLATRWHEFVEHFPLLSQLKISRNIPKPQTTFRLLGFCDGSSQAYGCCVYIQPQETINSRCYLLRAKSKVCPLRIVSVPRIELLAAHMLVKLVHSILKENFPFKIRNVFLFSDSEIVLHWISIAPHKLKPFVANRVAEILELSNPSQWRHVSGLENPSDPISRGLFPQQLLHCDLYWNGPAFLQEPMENWPSNPALSLKEIPELKPSVDCLNVSTSDQPFVEIFNRYSSLTKLQHVIAYLHRFIQNCRNPNARLIGPITSSEQKRALASAAYVTQQHYFSKEAELIRQEKPLPSPLRKLSLFLDSTTGVIRAGGRLRFSTLPFDSKHPILLPKKAYLSKLLCRHYHLTTLHSGVNHVQALLQKNWWILSLRSLLRKETFSCLRCYRQKMKPENPFMADLPASRVRPSRAFSHTGMDFCGPFLVKESHRRKASCSKGYLCVFVCFSTKSTHLEMVSDLSTSAFLASFDRFTSRRGLPVCLYSDRGTNFVGASRQFKELQDWLTSNREELLTALATRGMEWKFSPPNAPNFGGLWESAVKSAKTLFTRLMGDTKLTFEEYSTVFARIEAVLNSRPITFLAASPNDNVDYLSPGHFLVGGPLLDCPRPSVPDALTPKTRWQLVQRLHQSFWRRWTSEYLHQLLPRQKWHSRTENLKVGDLVYLKKLNCGPLSWPIGRVIDVHPGKDGIIRVATVRTFGGTYLRPVNSLTVLPTQD